MNEALFLVTNFCSANCNHCHISTSEKNNYLQNEKQIFNSLVSFSKNKSFILLSGGEPLEISISLLKKIVIFLESKSIFYKIATGGHVTIENLYHLFENKSFFCGFSIGTDILIDSRNNNAHELKKIWNKNLNFLNLKKIPYSLTLTYDKSLHSFFTMNEQIFINCNPTFVMLNELENHKLDDSTKVELTNQVNTIFSKKIILGFQN